MDPKKLRNMLADQEWNEKVVSFGKRWIDQHKDDVQVSTQTTIIEECNTLNVAPKSYE
jgi:hypothetical protein